AAAAQSEDARAWSAQEQAAVDDAATGAKAALAEGNRAYEQRFGFIFIVCATGKSSEEMLAMLQSRLQNDRTTETSIAADEQRKITRLRLQKLLGNYFQIDEARSKVQQAFADVERPDFRSVLTLGCCEDHEADFAWYRQHSWQELTQEILNQRLDWVD